MQEALLSKYSKAFPSLKAKLESLKQPYSKKLWNQLTNLILEFLYDKQTKNKVDFDFYDSFVKEFEKNLDNIKLLKIIRMCLHNQPKELQLAFLQQLEKASWLSEQAKLIVRVMQGIAYTEQDITKCLPIIDAIQKQIEGKKDIEQYLYSTFYKLAFLYYRKKGKHRQFYSNALQYLAYTNENQMNDKEKIDLSYEMGLAVILSKDIFNFSELLEQPLLKELVQSPYAWVYKLLEIFNRGDVNQYATFRNGRKEKIFQDNINKIDQKVQVAAFLEQVFNQPKNDRVLSFSKIAVVTGVSEDKVQWVIMRAMALNLVRGGIDQLKRTVTTSWVQPKVLEPTRIKVMESKFDQWNSGIKNLQTLLHERQIAQQQ